MSKIPMQNGLYVSERTPDFKAATALLAQVPTARAATRAIGDNAPVLVAMVAALARVEQNEHKTKLAAAIDVLGYPTLAASLTPQAAKQAAKPAKKPASISVKRDVKNKCFIVHAPFSWAFNRVARESGWAFHGDAGVKKGMKQGFRDSDGQLHENVRVIPFDRADDYQKRLIEVFGEGTNIVVS